MYRIILASGSPRRKELLSLMGVTYEVMVSQKEEKLQDVEPSGLVMELAKMKACDIAQQIEGPAVIIGADTVVACKNKVLGKPKDTEDARQMITMLAGNSHEVYTGVTMVIKEANQTERMVTFYEATKVYVTPMNEEEIRAYVATGEPMDKAGSYAIQGVFAPYISKIEGDYYNIVGFPISHLYHAAKEAGIDLRTGMRCSTGEFADRVEAGMYAKTKVETYPKAEDEVVEKLDEDLEAFLDAETYMEKIKVLERIRRNLNEYRMSSIEISLDLPVGENDLERRYQIVIDNLETRMRFECGRLR